MYTIIITLIFLFVFLPIMTYANSERLKRKKKLEKYGSVNPAKRNAMVVKNEM